MHCGESAIHTKRVWSGVHGPPECHEEQQDILHQASLVSRRHAGCVLWWANMRPSGDHSSTHTQTLTQTRTLFKEATSAVVTSDCTMTLHALVPPTIVMLLAHPRTVTAQGGVSCMSVVDARPHDVVVVSYRSAPVACLLTVREPVTSSGMSECSTPAPISRVTVPAVAVPGSRAATIPMQALIRSPSSEDAS